MLQPLQLQEQSSSVGCQLLDLPALGADPSPKQLMRQLSLFYPEDLDSQPQAAPQTDLMLSANYNLAHPAFSSEVPESAAVPLEAMPATSAPRINTSEFVRTCFAEMGRKQ